MRHVCDREAACPEPWQRRGSLLCEHLGTSTSLAGLAVLPCSSAGPLPAGVADMPLMNSLLLATWRPVINSC